MGYHLSRSDREQILASFTFMDSIHSLLKMEGIEELIDSKHRGRLKSAATHGEKAFTHFLENLDDDEYLKLNNLIKQCVVAVISKAHKSKRDATLAVEPRYIYDLAELAIDNHCTGCKVKKFKACKVYGRLMKATIPAAQTTNRDCPYRQ